MRRVSAWTPALVVALLALVLSCAWGVAATDVIPYWVYITLAVVVPGTIIWRAWGPGAVFAMDDLVLGAACGYAVETTGGVVLSLAGASAHAAPLLGWLLACLALAEPRSRARVLRRRERLPRSTAWGYSLVLVLLLVWLAVTVFARQPLVWSGQGGPENDLLFALALAGEASHRWPLQFPWVSGEPLVYHWFFAEHLAVAHHVSGVTLPVLLLRLDLLTTVVLVALTTGVLAVRLSRRAWAGPLAAMLLLVVQDLSPVPWRELSSDMLSTVTGVPYDAILWWSTSAGYAAIVFAPLVVLVVDALRHGLRAPGWALLALFALVGAGAKGSVLPVVAGGLVLTAASQWRAGSHAKTRRALALLGLVAGAFGTAWALLYRGESQGLEVLPVRFVMTTALGSGVLGEGAPGASALVAIGVLMLCVLAGSATWGAGLLLARRTAAGDPAGQLVLGMGLVGLAGMTLLFHVGQSNLYFLRTALPCLAAASAWALATAQCWSRIPAAATAAAALLGSASAILLSQGDWFSFATRQPAGSRLLQAAIPYAAVVCLAAVLAIAARTFRRRRTAASTLPGALVVAAVTLAGAGAVQVPAQALHGVGVWMAGNTGDRASNPHQQIDYDSIRAAAFIRDVSQPTDVVVTNVLCAAGASQDPHCDNRVFWVSAYSERRTVLSGSGYTVSANRLALETHSATPWTLPHWDGARLDRVRTFFREPTARAAGAFAAEGVRWVLIVDGYEPASTSIDRVADLRFSAGKARVYALKTAATTAVPAGAQSRPSSP